VKDEKSSNLERGIDVAAVAVATVNPFAAVAMTAVNKVGHALVDRLVQRGRDEEVSIFMAAVGEAGIALSDGDEDVAQARINLLADNDNFRRAAKKAAREMLDQPPCAEAVKPIGLLIAEYTLKRPDAEYRRWLGFLCEVTPEELTVFEEVVAGVVKMPGRLLACRTEEPNPLVAGAELEGKKVRAVLKVQLTADPQRRPPRAVVLFADQADAALLRLLDHGLAEHQRLNRTPGSNFDKEWVNIKKQRLTFAAKLLGLDVGATTAE